MMASAVRALIPAVCALFALWAHAAWAEDAPAQSKRKDTPAYPVSCYPEDVATPVDQTVDVGFDIDRDGLTENVEVLRSSNPCFEEAAIAAVRSWTYEPRRVDKRAQPQTAMQVKFRFVYQGETITNEFDAKPIKRIPPRYPDNCARRADDEERVKVQFDVSEEGVTENIFIAESTDRCFDSAARRSVEKWEYRPRIVDGVPQKREGVVTVIVFQLGDGAVSKDMRIRRNVANKLNQARRLAQKGRNEEALTLLNKFEEDFGDSLSRAELAEFHRMRGAVRLAVEDYEGALDDLRIVQRLGARESYAAISEAIAKLETALGVSDVPPAANADGPDTETE